jgi:hypothetical protein
MMNSRFVATQLSAGDIGDYFLVRRPEAVFALIPVVHAQQQGAILFPAPRLLPKFCRLHRGHQQLQCAGTVHFLADYRFDLAQHAQTQGHPGKEPGSQSPYQACSEHQLMADDLCFRRYFLESRETEFRIAHVVVPS